jgi:hypothetical protein
MRQPSNINGHREAVTGAPASAPATRDGQLALRSWAMSTSST